MLYCLEITVPANTPKENPVEKEVEIQEDVIVKVSIRFPPGPSGLLKVAVFYGEEQITPFHEHEWIAGDDEVVEDTLYFKCPEKPCPITIKAYNLDEAYDHTALVRILALNEEYALPHVAASSALKAIKEFFRKIWGGPL